jgi:hypothetical protein
VEEIPDAQAERESPPREHVHGCRRLGGEVGRAIRHGEHAGAQAQAARALGNRGEEDHGIEARLQRVIGHPEGVKAPALSSLRQVPWSDVLDEVGIGQPDVNCRHLLSPAFAVALRHPTVPPDGGFDPMPFIRVLSDACLLGPSVVVSRGANCASALPWYWSQGRSPSPPPA